MVARVLQPRVAAALEFWALLAFGAAGSYTWRAHVADLERVVDHYAPGARKVILAGSGWGAMLVLLYAWQTPGRVAALVLSSVPAWPRVSHPPTGIVASDIDPSRLPPHVRARLDSLVARMKVGARLPPDRAGGVRSGSSVQPELYGLDSASVAQLPERCRAVFEATRRSLMRTVPVLDSLQVVTVPTLIIRAAGLAFDGGAEVSAVLPHARLVAIEGGGRRPWELRPERFFAAVAEFLGRVEGGSAK